MQQICGFKQKTTFKEELTATHMPPITSMDLNKEFLGQTRG